MPKARIIPKRGEAKPAPKTPAPRLRVKSNGEIEKSFPFQRAKAVRLLVADKGENFNSIVTSCGNAKLTDGRIVQVFVAMVVVDPDKLRDQPETGGLMDTSFDFLAGTEK